ncbi:MAG: hypothetical protein EBU46_16550 [Nitrosomonadaceae bacterium]|nr:hypothetical protein [Nitrosomonadaceae bacterium]
MSDASSVRAASALPVATGRNASSVRYINGELAIANGTNWTYPGRSEITFIGGTTDAAFFVANSALEILSIREVHSAAGSDSGAVTLNVTKDTGTNAPGAGVTVQTGTFNLKAAANTVQTATLTATAANKKLAAGDRLSANFTGTVTDVAGVVVTVTVRQI